MSLRPLRASPSAGASSAGRADRRGPRRLALPRLSRARRVAGCAAGCPAAPLSTAAGAEEAARAAQRPDTQIYPSRRHPEPPCFWVTASVPGAPATGVGVGGVQVVSREPALQSRGRHVRSARPPPAAAPRHAAPHLAPLRTQIKGPGGGGVPELARRSSRFHHRGSSTWRPGSQPPPYEETVPFFGEPRLLTRAAPSSAGSYQRQKGQKLSSQERLQPT